MPLAHSWQFTALGTAWSVHSAAPLSRGVQREVLTTIEQFDAAYSRFRDDSQVSALATHGGRQAFASELGFGELFSLYRELYEQTNGAVTPLVGARLSTMGYDSTYSLKAAEELADVPGLNEIVVHADDESIELNRPALLDFGAAGKGLVVDAVSDLLRRRDVSEFVVDGSGDMVHHAKTPYMLGLEDPTSAARVLGTIRLNNEALCASAVNRRAWQNAHHVLDGRTGAPTHAVVATWVIAPSALVADGLATALFFLENPDEYCHEKQAVYLRIFQTGILEMNEPMKARVELFS